MAPLPALTAQIDDLIKKHKVMIFAKTTCPFCHKVMELMRSIDAPFEVLQLDKRDDGAQLQATLHEMTGQKTVPSVFINGKHIGGSDDTFKLHQTGALQPLIQDNAQYDYDLIVIGGGSGGLSAAKEAARLGAKVACFDFVKPSPLGTTWGLGGTCVNVGCIPKKLMHQAALLSQSLSDSRSFGWEVPESVKHNWTTMKDAIQDHVRSLNWGYRVALREKNVQYINAYAEFTGPHHIKSVNKAGKVTEMTGNKFILCTGERPRYPDIPGAKELCITSDDLFSLEYCPGKTLVIGASYVALECAGFLAGLGMDVTVMVRSILLRGFDQEMAELIGEFMVSHGIKFQRGYVPVKTEQIEAGSPGRVRVTGKPTSGSGPEIVEEYNTVLLGIGRDPCTSSIGLDCVGVKRDKNGYIIANDGEQSNIENIYAVGDIVSEKPKLTPVAIQAGKLLARRLFDGSSVLTDYNNVATTVFTPLEYGCIGLSEEDARAKFGDDKIEVYHKNFKPLEWTVPGLADNACYAKLVTHKPDNERVVGFHVVGPNAGEMTQGYAVAMRLGASKNDFDMTVGIHPTCSEVFTQMDIAKSSGLNPEQSGC